MAYREVRDFCEIMRSLGYPRIISMENFRTPNFELVADILYWLALRVDPDCNISDDIEEERQRIKFITSLTSFFLTKTRTRLNMRKLYQSDGYAVKELLKIAGLLNKAQSTSAQDLEESSNFDITLTSKLQNLKTAKGLASEITDSGAKLFDLLGKEAALKEAREKALAFLDNFSNNLDSNAEQDYIRRCIKDIIQNQESSLSQMGKMLEDLEKDEKNLEAKIKKRSVELERAEKRMKSLQTVRPAFMDEYDKVEQELEKVYEYYVAKFRNLAYLESDLEKYSKIEEEKNREASEQLDKDRKKYKEDDIRFVGEDEDAFDREAMADEINRQRPMVAKPNQRKNFNQDVESDDSDQGEDDDEDASDLDIEEDDDADSVTSNEDF